MYCNFNIKLFNPFTSMKVKIIPQLSDDWEMIPYEYRRDGGFSLRSEKLNQEIADIDIFRFLKFSKEQNLIIEGLKLKGKYIIGSDRSVYTEEMFNKWTDKFASRTATIIPKKDWILGHKYKTPCGAEVIYVGKRYVTSIKGYENDYSNLTKEVLKYFISSERGGVGETKMKFSEDLGMVRTEEECSRLLNGFDKMKPRSFFSMSKNAKVEFIECDANDSGALYLEDKNGLYYINLRGRIGADGVHEYDGAYRAALLEFDIHTMKASTFGASSMRRIFVRGFKLGARQ